MNKGVPNEIMIKNIGDEVAAQYNDPKTVEYYKSANIFINPIVLEGKGAELVQITKVAAPTRIIVGKKSTVTLRYRMICPGQLRISALPMRIFHQA